MVFEIDINEPYSEEYVRRKVNELYFNFRGIIPSDNSPAFRRLRNRILYEFNISKEHLHREKVKTVGDLIKKIVGYSIPGISPIQRDLIEESENLITKL